MALETGHYAVNIRVELEYLMRVGAKNKEEAKEIAQIEINNTFKRNVWIELKDLPILDRTAIVARVEPVHVHSMGGSGQNLKPWRRQYGKTSSEKSNH